MISSGKHRKLRIVTDTILAEFMVNMYARNCSHHTSSFFQDVLLLSLIIAQPGAKNQWSASWSHDTFIAPLEITGGIDRWETHQR